LLQSYKYHEHTHAHTKMENSTALPVVSDCMTQEHEGLYVAVMVVLSAIWMMMAMLVRARASARQESAHAPGGEMV